MRDPRKKDRKSSCLVTMAREAGKRSDEGEAAQRLKPIPEDKKNSGGQEVLKERKLTHSNMRRPNSLTSKAQLRPRAYCRKRRSLLKG